MENKLEILSTHYSETFQLLKADVARRDRLFLYMLTVVLLILLYMSTPESLSDWINSFVIRQAGSQRDSTISHLIDISFVGSILWLGLLTLSHTYFQTVLHIERQYDYIYRLEKQISKHFDEKAFIREGKHYRANMSKFSSWTKFIFWNLIPVLILVFIVFWLIFLFNTSNATIVYLVVDSLISLTLLISMGLYLIALFKKK